MARKFGSLDVASSSSLETGFQGLNVGGDSETPQIKFAPKKYGTFGRPCDLFVNFFKIELRNAPNYFHYNIEIVGEVDEGAAPQPSSSGGGGGGKGRKAAQQKKTATNSTTEKRFNTEKQKVT